jgi:hypothetical protein
MLRSLLIAAAALLAAAAPATARIDSHQVRKSPAEVRGYWTAERMRDAIPMERARAGDPRAAKGKPGSTSSWATLKVSWPASSALDAHGKVFFTDGAYNYVCSGTLVDSTSGSVVWTAGHCVNEGPGAYFTNWTFVPAYNRNGVREPYGRWAARSLHTTTEWRTQANAYGRDLGAAKVEVKDSTLEGAVGTARTLGTNPSTVTASNPIDSYGYPAAGKYSGQDMYLCDSYISRRDGSTSPATYGIPCGMTGGSSGGGWIDVDDGKLVSVNSYGYQSLKNTMFGPVQDATAGSLLTAANSG